MSSAWRDEFMAFGRIDLPVDLIDQRVKFLVVPHRIVLRSARAIPGIEIIRRIEQRRDDRADRQIEMAAGGIVEPDRLDRRAQVALHIEPFLQHRLDRLRPQLEARHVAHQKIEPVNAVG